MWDVVRGMTTQQRFYLRKVQLITHDFFPTARWSLPVIEPDHLPARLPLPRPPVYPHIPRKVRLLPIP